MPIPVTNPTSRVGQCGGEGGTGEQGEQGKQSSRGAKKTRAAFMETACTLLIALMNLMPHFHPEPMMSMMMMTYLWTLHELHKTRWKAKERKEWLWQLLLQRNAGPATPTILVVAAPFCSQVFTTSTPRTSPGYHPHQGVVTTHLQEKGDRGRVQDFQSGRNQWRPLVQSVDLHLLAQTG